MPSPDGTPGGPVDREQQRIAADVETALQYGTEHPDEFAGLRYENSLVHPAAPTLWG